MSDTTTENNTLEPIISATAIVITDNFEQLKASLIEQIKLYEIEVTDDNLTEAKKMATELNKLSTAINRIKIDKSKEFAAPIEEFKKKAAELVDIVQGGREKILKQVEAFDLKVIKTVTSLLATERTGLFEAMAVKPEFQTVKIESLAIKSNLTTSGQLTKTAKDRLAEMVAADRAMQETVESRIANLQAIAERAGLVSLPESVVATFVRDPEASYSEKLNRLIDAEIKRQRELEEKIRLQEAEKLAKQQPQPEAPKAVVAHPQIIVPVTPASVAAVISPEKSFRVEFMGTISDGQTVKCVIEWLDALGSGENLIITRE
jgi:hypothetical protein